MLTAPLKIGIAVACLVAVAVLIAMDAARSQRNDLPPAPPAAASVAAVLPAAFPAPEVPVRLQPRDVVICPAIPAHEAATKGVAAPVAETVAKENPPAEDPKVYTVLQGDTLYGISVKVFGTPRHYERIYQANRDRIADPNTLQIGINLKMPDVASKSTAR